MKLKYTEVEELNNAIASVPLKGGAVLDFAMNVIELGKILEGINQAKAKMINKYTEGKSEITSKHEKWNEFIEEWTSAISKEVEFKDLIKIKKTDLDLTRSASQQNVATLLKYDLLV